VTWSTTPDGRAGLRRHRSHEVVAVEHCPIAHPGLPDVLSHRWDAPQVEAIVSSTDQQLLVTDATVPKDLHVDGVAGTDGARRAGRTRLTERVEDHDFTVTGSGFWQVHPAAARTLVDAVLEAAEARPGDRVADLYAGVGLFTAFLADRVGPQGAVVSVEADTQAARDARRSLHRYAQVRLVSATTEQALRHDDDLRRGVDLVVLDPPRTGARRAVPDVARLGARRVVYVACDPAALARDVATFAEHGYRLGDLRAFALFPMTHHVECVAVLDRIPDAD
jgi:tRNA/tmRNA/rRNA uracil-C5-methylase (TrmA/RlmC/RlmD family)